MTKLQLMEYLKCKGVNLDSIVGTGTRVIDQEGRRNITKYDLVNVAVDLTKRGLESAAGSEWPNSSCAEGCPMSMPDSASVASSGDCDWLIKKKYGGGEYKEDATHDLSYSSSSNPNPKPNPSNPIVLLPEPCAVFEKAMGIKLKQPCEQLSRIPIFPNDYYDDRDYDIGRLWETVMGLSPTFPKLRTVAVFKTAPNRDGTLLAMEVGPSPYFRVVWMECIKRFREISKKQPSSVVIVDEQSKIRLVRPMQLKSEPWICETENGQSAFAFIHIDGDWHLFTAQKALSKRLLDRSSALAAMTKLVEGDSDDSIPGSDILHFAWKEDADSTANTNEKGDVGIDERRMHDDYSTTTKKPWLTLAITPLPYYFD